MSRARAAPGPRAGFTLLELLVAMTLFALLMSAMFGGLRLGTRIWESAETRLDDAARLQVVEDFLRRRLEGALPLLVSDEAAGTQIALFDGAADGLTFANVLPGHLGAGLYRIRIGQETPDGADAPALVLRWQRFEPGSGATAGTITERVLIEDIAALEMAYFGALDEAAPPTWQSSWRAAYTLPHLVRIDIRFPPGDPRHIAPLLLRPMVDLAETLQY